MKRVVVVGLALTCLVLGVAALAGPDTKPAATPAGKTEAMAKSMQTTATTMMAGHITKTSELTWKDAPGYPTGVKMAEAHGATDPKGASAAYLKIPAGTKIMAHTHPAVHWGTIVSGTGTFGLGSDPTKGTDVGPGDFVYIPMSAPHWYTAKTETLFFASMMGEPGITYVNPTDDPRKGQATSQ